MALHSDISQRVVIDSAAMAWASSPCEGVSRRRLECQSGKFERVTSIVEYAAESQYHMHGHERGEEILVLSGVFCDEYGQYPEGTYIRNPAGFRHAPFSMEGCTIFVKLQQAVEQDKSRVVINTKKSSWYSGMVRGLQVMPLHSFDNENVALVRWQPGTQFSYHKHAGGEEIYVVEGVFSDEFGDYPKGTWIRSPADSAHRPYSENGCLIYVKTGHLCSVVCT